MLSPLVQGQSSSLNIGLHPLKSISEREHQSDYSDALLKPPSLPSRTSSSHSNLPLKQKPSKPKKLQGDSSITTSHTPGYNSNYTHNVFQLEAKKNMQRLQNHHVQLKTRNIQIHLNHPDQ